VLSQFAENIEFFSQLVITAQGREDEFYAEPRASRWTFGICCLFFLVAAAYLYSQQIICGGNATATVSNIAAQRDAFSTRAWRATLAGAVVLIFLTLAFYRLFKGVDRNLAVQVVIFGGVMPALLYFVAWRATLACCWWRAERISCRSSTSRSETRSRCCFSNCVAFKSLRLRRCGSLAFSAGVAGVPVAFSAAVFGGVARSERDCLCGAQLYGCALAGMAAHGVCVFAACDVWGDGVDALVGDLGC